MANQAANGARWEMDINMRCRAGNEASNDHPRPASGVLEGVHVTQWSKVTWPVLARS